MGGKETRDFGSGAGNCFEGFPEARSLPARGGGRAAFYAGPYPESHGVKGTAFRGHRAPIAAAVPLTLGFRGTVEGR